MFDYGNLHLIRYHSNEKSDLISKFHEFLSPEKGGEKADGSQRIGLIPSESRSIEKEPQTSMDSLDYLTSMTDMGCVKIEKKVDYLETDFTDCALFCLGRNFSRIFIGQIPNEESRSKCVCNPFLEVFDYFQNDPNCVLTSFKLVFEFRFLKNSKLTFK